MSDADLQNGLAQAQFMPDATSLGTSPTEAFSAAYDAGHRSASNYAVFGNMSSALQDHLDMVEQKTGQKFDNPLADYTYNPKAPDITRNTAQALAELAQKRGDPSLAMPDFDTLYQGGVEKARAAQRTVAQQEGGPMAFGAGAAGFLGGIAGQMTDPESLALNTAAFALFKQGGPVVISALRSAAGFAAGQLANTADSFEYKRAINPEYGFADAAKEVGSAAAFGAGADLAGAGVAALWRRLRSSAPSVAAAIPQPLQDAGNVAERQADLDAQNPFNRGLAGAQAHREAITTIETALAEGKAPPDISNIEALNKPRLVVARKMPDGIVRYGKPGDIHSDLLGATEPETYGAEEMGFAEPGGPFLSRKEAADYVVQNEPRVAANLEDKNRLEAGEYVEPQPAKALDMWSEHPDGGIRNLISALKESKMQEVEPPHNIMPSVVQAVEAIAKAKDEGKPVSEVLTQGDKFYSDQAQQAARLFLNDDGKIASKAAITDNLSTYAKQVSGEVAASKAAPIAPQIGEHELGLIRAATTPAEAEILKGAPPLWAKTATDPKVHDAMMADLQRNIEQGNNRVPIEDAQGNSALGFADKEMQDILNQEAAAREIAGCATPAGAAE